MKFHGILVGWQACWPSGGVPFVNVMTGGLGSAFSPGAGK